MRSVMLVRESSKTRMIATRWRYLPNACAMRSSVLALPLLLCLSLIACQSRSQESTEPPDGARVEAAMAIDGVQYELIEGGVYQVDERSGERAFVTRLYEPGFYKRNYEKTNGTIYRRMPSGKKYAVRTSLEDGFENAKTLHDLIGVDRQWTSLTLQGPSAPTVSDYVALRKRIINRESDFVDNRIEPSTEQVHGGRQSLRCYAVPPSPTMQLTKASLDNDILHFVKGDHVWMAGWFFVEQGRPTTLMDLECSFIDKGPGMRILMTEQMRPYLELKWVDKPTFRPKRDQDIVFPRNRWFHVKAHFLLSEKQDGIAELWLDGRKIIEGKGQTFPVAEAVYDRLQVGITANPKGTTTVLYVDDVQVSAEPIE